METTTRTELGDIHISDRAISVIAAQRASAVAHVKGLEGSLADAAARKFGHENRGQGIEAKLDGNRVELTVRLIVEAGCRIPDVALQVQRVSKTVWKALQVVPLRQFTLSWRAFLFPMRGR